MEPRNKLEINRFFWRRAWPPELIDCKLFKAEEFTPPTAEDEDDEFDSIFNDDEDGDDNADDAAGASDTSSPTKNKQSVRFQSSEDRGAARPSAPVVYAIIPMKSAGLTAISTLIHDTAGHFASQACRPDLTNRTTRRFNPLNLLLQQDSLCLIESLNKTTASLQIQKTTPWTRRL